MTQPTLPLDLPPKPRAKRKRETVRDLCRIMGMDFDALRK